MKLSEFYNLKEREGQLVESSKNNKVEELILILDVVRKINSSLKLDEVLKTVLSNALQITDTWRGFILLKKSNNKLIFRLGLDKFGVELFESSFSVSDLVISDVFSSGESVIIAGAENEEEKRYLSNSTIFPVQTIFCSPLIVEEEKIGVIYVDCHKLRKIKKIDITYVFEILSEQASIAINNALIHEELEKEYRKTENAEKLKDDLFTLISHEFRNPLNFMMTHAQLLQDVIDGLLDQEYLESFEIINRGGRRLLRSIELVMNTSEINSGSYEVREEDINIVDDILEPLIHENENLAYGKNINLKLNNKLKKITLLKCDRHSLVMIFAHLINNAIKFTDKGEVIVNAYNEEDTGDVSVDVIDTGIGISADYLPDIFEQFTQEESGYTRSYDGMGLGLALVKSYCDLNGLKISVITKKNFGSTFKVEFNR